jgi:hypothetical protein
MMTVAFDFTTAVAPFFMGAGAVAIIGVVAVAVAVMRAEWAERAVMSSAEPRVELKIVRPAA